MGRFRWPRSSVVLGCALPLALGACDGCHGSKPYTPYTLGSSSGAAGSGAGPAPAPNATFAVAAGTPAAGDGTSWTLAPGVVAKPPAGRVFVVGLVVDVDQDQKPDLLAWARSLDGLRGELWYAPGSRPEAGRTIGALPGDLSIPGCAPSVALGQVGPHTAALDYGLTCAQAVHGSPQRWVASIRLPASGPSLGLELRVAAPRAGEVLKVALDGADKDGDGIDDVTANITLSGAVAPFPDPGAVTASIRFFDRPTGFSRDATEPDASLRDAAGKLLGDARKKASAASVPPLARQLRRLRSMLCDEGASLFTTSAGPLRCGEPRSVADSAFAEGVAAVTVGDATRATRAIGALDALGAAGAGRKKELDKVLGKAVPEASATVVRTTQAAPAGEGAGKPGWSPLSFEPSGDLLVRTANAVVRIDHATFAETSTDITPWPTAIAWLPDGAPARPEMEGSWRLVGVEQRCAEPQIMARVQSGATTVEAPLPVPGPTNDAGLPLLAGRCGAVAYLPVVPLGISSAGLLFTVGLEPIALGASEPGKPAVSTPITLPVTAALRPSGAARSPDGATVAVPIARGVLVTTGPSGKRWTGNDLALAWGCVPSNGGTRIACVVGNAAAILEAR